MPIVIVFVFVFVGKRFHSTGDTQNVTGQKEQAEEKEKKRTPNGDLFQSAYCAWWHGEGRGEGRIIWKQDLLVWDIQQYFMTIDFVEAVLPARMRFR